MTPVRFVCPACKGGLEEDGSGYRCAPCARAYPVLFGIPDFRLRPDPYLSLEDERAKAGRLHEYGRSASFEELVAYYYAVTDDVPDALAVRYRAYIRAAPGRGAGILADFDAVAAGDSLIDLGCGTGGVLVAAAPAFGAVVGVDIALRWLVICAKRLAEAGVEATLVCADAEALPFPEARFSHAVAADLVEHVHDVDQALAEISARLRPGGALWLSATNRYCIGPQPLVRVWGIGFLPRHWRSRVLTRIRGVDSLRHANLVSPLALAARCRAAGLDVLRAEPAHVGATALEDYPRFDRLLISVYRAALRLGPLRYLLVLVGPAFQMLCRRARHGDPLGGST